MPPELGRSRLSHFDGPYSGLSSAPAAGGGDHWQLEIRPGPGRHPAGPGPGPEGAPGCHGALPLPAGPMTRIGWLGNRWRNGIDKARLIPHCRRFVVRFIAIMMI